MPSVDTKRRRPRAARSTPEPDRVCPSSGSRSPGHRRGRRRRSHVRDAGRCRDGLPPGPIGTTADVGSSMSSPAILTSPALARRHALPARQHARRRRRWPADAAGRSLRRPSGAGWWETGLGRELHGDVLPAERAEHPSKQDRARRHPESDRGSCADRQHWPGPRGGLGVDGVVSTVAAGVPSGEIRSDLQLGVRLGLRLGLRRRLRVSDCEHRPRHRPRRRLAAWTLPGEDRCSWERPGRRRDLSVAASNWICTASAAARARTR